MRVLCQFSFIQSLFIVIQFISFILSYQYGASSSETICDGLCACIPSEKVIACNKQDKIKQIPNKIDSNIRKLIIQSAEFSDPYLYQKNFTGLENLSFLKIIYCKVIGVESRAFQLMTQLIYLDLSHNFIKIIQPYTFSGLRLEELHLTENPGIKLNEYSFGNLLVESINLRSNEIDKIQYDTFSNLQLKKLYLYNNQISYLSPKFGNIFAQPRALIDLTANPLSCTCEMKWILPLLKIKLEDPSLRDITKSINFKCSSPMKLSGRDIAQLDIKEMSCPSPKIKSISVLFGVPITQLTCIAVGNNFRAPGVAWNYIESENVKRELSRTPMKGQSDNQQALQTSLTVNVTTQPNKLKEFTCSTWLEDSQMEKIVVNIKSPDFIINNWQNQVNNKQQKQPMSTAPSSKYTSDRNSNNEAFVTIDESNFIFKKQFTVLEMIGAVIGTFIGTLLALIVVIQVIKCFRRNSFSSHPSNYKAVNILKPYWTLGHDSNNTYSHPISTSAADYDTPRIYDSNQALGMAPGALTPRVPPSNASLCQSPPLLHHNNQRMEFIDYKNQNRIYTAS